MSASLPRSARRGWTVFRRLRVALFSTGDELSMPGEPLKPGGIYNSNRYTLRALLEGLGCEVADLGIVPDSRDATRAALREAAAGNDLILTSGGVSVGEEDHVKPAVEAEGALDLWKIAIKPGKPLAFGSVRRKVGADGAAAFIGLPGNPVSSFVTFLMLVRPFILKAQGDSKLKPHARGMQADFACPGRPAPRIPARPDQCRGRPGPVRQPEFRRADVLHLGRRPDRQSATTRHRAWRHGAFPAVFRTAIVATGSSRRRPGSSDCRIPGFPRWRE
jgi:molybdenum cofactor synthesis domain-containing protein